MRDVDDSQTLRRVGFILLGGLLVGMTDALSVAVGARLGIGMMGVLGLALMSGTAAVLLSTPAFLCALAVRRVVFRSAFTSAWVGAVLPLGCWLGVALAESEMALGGLWGSLGLMVALTAGLAGALIVVTRGVARGDAVLAGAALTVASGLVLSGRNSTPTTVPSSVEQPNVLLVTISSLRADRLGAHRTDTAALDRLVAEGARFDLAVTPSLDTSDAARAILLGQQPWRAEHPEHPESLAGRLAQRGYATGAFVGTDALGRSHHLDEGFSVFDDDHGWPKGQAWLFPHRVAAAAGWVSAARDRRASDVVDRALRFIQSRDSAWFTWVHLDDPAAPYVPPSPWDERYYQGRDPRDPGQRSLGGGQAIAAGHGRTIRGVTDADYVEARYDGEVAFTDAQVLRLLAGIDDLNLSSQTLVVVAGTQGETLQDGTRWFGHEEVSPATVDVPLVMRWPGRVPVGARVEAPFELVDLGATVLDYAGVASTALGEGVSVKPAVEGRGEARVRARSRHGTVGAVREFGLLWTLDTQGALDVRRVDSDGPRSTGATDERIQASVAAVSELMGVVPPAVDPAALRQLIEPKGADSLTPGFVP